MYNQVPNNLNFGVEMELTFPVNVDFRNALPWKKHNDSSIRCDVGRNCQTIELVSPILSGENGITQVIKVMTQCKSKGATTNTSTGFHVHISVNNQNYSLEDLIKISHNFLKYEHSIDLIMAPSRLDNNYCQSNRNLLPKDNDECKNSVYNCQSIQQLQRLMCKSRYYGLNLMALDKHGTIEFRQHLGSLNLEQVESWIRFTLWFVQNSIAQPRSLALNNERNCEFGFEAMFKFLIKDNELRNYYYKRKDELERHNNGVSGCKCGC